MTEQEAIEELQKISLRPNTLGGTDWEAVHLDADDLLCQLLADAGYEEFVKAYNELTTDFWYA